MDELVKYHLETLFVFNDARRIVSTREPQATAGPAFMLVRSTTGCSWAINANVPATVAKELNHLAGEEPVLSDLHDAPVHADRYQAILGGRLRSGPAFTFPEAIPQPQGVVSIEDEQLLDHSFHGWIPGEIRAGRAPVMAVIQDDHPASICFCARRSSVAAEAGVETALQYRGYGFGPRVVAAWAIAVRRMGLIPLYSTDWSNAASLALAGKLGLAPYAIDWSLSPCS